ncbi:hypothetical protein [Pantoea sp. MBLJ3]|uniref:hypothetical protein n=1 Tax=Pantoea sp. MBLJ3 TaxID=1562889 RepID=UPI000690308D|nr:hypothetical protein [Pantoea sp. MBLJ3]
MKIIKKMTGIKWIGNVDGGAYYNDDKGNDWYQFRNSLAEDKPIIVVLRSTRDIIMFWKGDPTFVGLLNEELDVYQLDYFLVDTQEEFLSRKFKFSEDGVVTETTVKPPQRTKEDIMSDLIKLQEELKIMM